MIQIILTSLTFLCISGMLFCIYMLFRNNRVYRLRTKILNKSYSIYKTLPEYEEMMYSFKLVRMKSWLTKEQIETLEQL